MVFPTVSYSSKINAKFEPSKKFRLSHPKVGPRHAPNRLDRIVAYDRAFQRYVQMDSKLAKWKLRMDQRGLPGPLADGYQRYQRSSSSWQHSLSSVSSDSSTCTNDSYTVNKTRKAYDIKPTKSITITTTSTISPPAPIPKPSVSRRIINRLSLSRSNSKNHHSSKVTPTTTQSLRRGSTTTSQKYEGPSVIIHPLPTPSFSVLQQQKQNSQLSPRMSLDQHLHQNDNNSTKRRSLCHYVSPSPRLPVPASCGIEDYLSQKRYSRLSTISTQPLVSTRTRSTIIH